MFVVLFRGGARMVDSETRSFGLNTESAVVMI